LGDYKYTEANKNHKLNSEEEEVLDAVFRAAEFLTSEYELKDVLLLLAKQISKIMNADGCSINLLDQNTNTIIDSLDFKMNENLEIELKKETIFKIVENNDVYYINRHDKEFSTIFKKNNKIKTLICVPIRIRSHVSGIIQIYYEDYYLYSEEEYRYLSAFARQAAIAIEDTRLMGRSALLQESHHRIKNNLQAIVNLISLQKRFNSSEDPKDINYILDNTISRVKSIAAVHDILSQERMGRSITNVKELINSIVKFINFGDKIEVKLDLADIFIPYSKASSIALIINELINNSIKHAFDFNSNGIINIVCGRMDTSLLLKVTDNGVGFPENFNSSDLDSLGITIINSIVAKKFCGELEFYNDKGAVVKIKLPIKNIFLGK
jgi:ribose transport system ATP-binding protein